MQKSQKYSTKPSCKSVLIPARLFLEKTNLNSKNYMILRICFTTCLDTSWVMMNTQ